eukprot:3305310-Pyramimonas_sp.AAC.1
MTTSTLLRNVLSRVASMSDCVCNIAWLMDSAVVPSEVASSVGSRIMKAATFTSYFAAVGSNEITPSPTGTSPNTRSHCLVP